MIRLTPPTRSGRVSSGWGDSRAYRGGWHAGLDFPGNIGDPLLAAASGVVSFVRDWDGSNAGKFMVIDHGGGVFTRYLHANALYKRKGDRVSRGEVIGEVGRTGIKSSAPHVHFDTKMQDIPLAEYVLRFGRPSTGFSSTMAPWGHGVPSEPLMDGAVYDPGVLERALARGVRPYTGTNWLVLGALAVAGGLLVARYVG